MSWRQRQRTSARSVFCLASVEAVFACAGWLPPRWASNPGRIDGARQQFTR